MRLIERVHRFRFGRAVRRMAATPPLMPGNIDVTVLSMVQHRDVLPYLLALKSLARFVRPARVVMVADPTIDANDRALLREHVPHLQMRDATEFHAPGRIRGGTWERLWAIAEHASDSHVVQLDADTVTLAPPQAVLAAIAEGSSFTLGTDDDQRILPVADIARWARSRLDGGDHVQQLAESNLDRLDPLGRWRYVRGCSGFAGFAQGSIDRERLAALSSEMQAVLGDKWSNWGTEQVSSNLIVASAPKACVLHHPTYCAPHRRNQDTVFLHFIGYVRHASALYAHLANTVAAELNAAVTSPSPGNV